MSTARTTWHARDGELAGYLAGVSPPVIAASLEAHLLHCADCRAALARIEDRAKTTQAWNRLADAIDRPSRTVVDRLPSGDFLSTSAIATPGMVGAALAAVVFVCIGPLVAVAASPESGLGLLLIFAPLAPVAAVAVAYGQWSDPAGELSLATPTAGLRLVAARALVVSGGAVPLAVLVSWLIDIPISLALAWCLPGLALAALVLLAGTTRFDPLYVATGISVGWALAIATPASIRRDFGSQIIGLVANPGTQVVALAVALIALAVTTMRRDAVAYRRA